MDITNLSAFSKSHFCKTTRPKTITFRNYKRFDENIFFNDLHKLNITLDEEISEKVDEEISYSLISNKVLEVVNKQAPL